MFMRYRVMSVKVRMPFAARNGFALVRMVMMPVRMLMVMNVLHNYVGMAMFVRKQIGYDNSHRQEENRNEVNPLERFMNK